MPSDNLFAAARAGARMTQEKAAFICGISIDSYRTREKQPGEFRVKELKLLADNMSESSRKILVDAVLSIFLPK